MQAAKQEGSRQDDVQLAAAGATSFHVQYCILSGLLHTLHVQHQPVPQVVAVGCL